jgi:tetratricopeptide (TPR) repeat protein
MPRRRRLRSAAPVALIGVFAIKLIVVQQLRDHPLLQADAGLDTTLYLELAREVLTGNVALAPGLYVVSPLYIYFLAAALAIADSLTAVRVVQAALGTVAVACIFIAARELFDRSSAWWAAGLAAFTGLFTFYEALILQAALDPALTAAALMALAIGRTHPERRGPFIAAGVAFGLQALNRPNVILAVLAIIVALVIVRPRRGAALLTAGLIVALVPASVRNIIVAGEWSPLASHGGLNFYIGNNADADGTYREVPGITPDMSGQRADARRVAEAALARPLDDGEVSEYFYARAWDWIRSNPGDAAALFARKLYLTFSGSHLWLNYSYPFFAYDVPTLLAGLVVGPGILMPLGLVGFGVRRGSDRGLTPWVVFIPAYAISVALFFAAERYRLPLLVPMCIGAGALLAHLVEFARARQVGRTIAPLAVAAALAAALNWPMGLDDGRSEQRVRMVERLILSGEYDNAAQWLPRALDGHPVPGVVHFRAGRALLSRSRGDLALPHLQDAARLNPAAPETSFALGQALLETGRAADAIPHLRRALDAGVRGDVAGFDLARAHAQTGNREAARAVLRTVEPANPSDAASWHALGALAEQLRDAAVAADFYRRAVAADPGAASSHRQLGLMLAVADRPAEAAAAFETLVALTPSDASAHLNLAVTYAQLDRLDDARRHAREALRLNPGYAKARALLDALR